MSRADPSNAFAKAAAGEPFGPPLIGALLRVPWEAVQRHMLRRLRERGFCMGVAMREAVGEMEAAWAERLGAERLSELRGLLLELKQPS